MRIFTDGAEMGDLLFWTSHTGSLLAASGSAASGTYYYQMGGWANATKAIADVAEFYFKARINIPSTGTLVYFYHTGTNVITVSIDSLARVGITVNGVEVYLSPYTIVFNAWTLYEVYIKVAMATGRIIVRVDGNDYIDFTGDTTWLGGPIHVDSIVFWSPLGGLGIDDLALNDLSNADGKGDTSWCGPGRVIKQTSVGNGAASDWMGSDGNQVNNYELVDEYPSDDDTSYIVAGGTDTGARDQYTLSDYDGTLKTVERIWAEARARKTSGAPASLKLGFDTGSSVNTDDVGFLYETYSTCVKGEEYKVNPDDSGIWEESDLDGLEFVAEVG